MTRNIELSLKRRNNLLTGLEPISHKKIFVTWKTIPAVPKDKKFPYLKNNILLKDSYNSSEVIDNLMTLNEAFEEQNKNRHTGVGISFFNNCGVAGLLLQVRKPTKEWAQMPRSWILRIKVGEQRQPIGLGSYPQLSLAAAREKAAELVLEAKQGQVTSGFGDKIQLGTKSSPLKGRFKHVL